MKKLRYFLVILIIFGTSCLSAFGAGYMKNSRLVKVNGTVITYGQLQKRLKEVNSLSKMTGKEYTEKEMLNSLIDDLLLVDILKKENMMISGDMLEKGLDKERESFVLAMKLDDGSYEFNQADFEKYILDTAKITYNEYVERMKLKYSIMLYIQKLAANNLDSVERKEYSDELLLKVRQEILPAFITPEHILLKHIFTKEKGKIKKAYDELAEGRNFDVVCKKYSEDQDSINKKDPLNGRLERGYLGRVPHTKDGFDIMTKEFKIDEMTIRTIFKLKEEKYTDVIKSPFGYHIFYVKQRVDEKVPTYEDMKENLINYVKIAERENVLNGTYANLLKRLRREADIKYYAKEFEE